MSKRKKTLENLLSKGIASRKTVTEEVPFENASMDACVLQGDSERAIWQMLR